MKLARTITIFAAAMWLIAGCVMAHAKSANPNYGKADDYGSDRWRMAASCLSRAVTSKEHTSFELCMNDNGFRFEPDNRIFGDRGPKCLDNDHLHSWCWEKDND
jgi:hypothetical protein